MARARRCSIQTCSRRDAAAVSERLGQANIPFTLGRGRNRDLLLTVNKVDAARLRVAQGGALGFWLGRL